MKGGSPSAFAKAREEIQLWPAAAMGFYVTLDGSTPALVGFIGLLMTGAITYRMHEALREALKQSNKRAKRRSQVSRDGIGNKAGWVRTGLDVWDAISPQHPAAAMFVVGAMLTNLAVGLWLFWRLGLLLLSSSSPSTAAVGLFALPLLMLASMSATLVWQA